MVQLLIRRHPAYPAPCRVVGNSLRQLLCGEANSGRVALAGLVSALPVLGVNLVSLGIVPLPISRIFDALFRMLLVIPTTNNSPTRPGVFCISSILGTLYAARLPQRNRSTTLMELITVLVLPAFIAPDIFGSLPRERVIPIAQELKVR